MIKTFFNTNCTWIRLQTEDEINILINAIEKRNYPGKINRIEKDSNNIYALVDKPDPWYGLNYSIWEKIKSDIYCNRKANRLE